MTQPVYSATFQTANATPLAANCDEIFVDNASGKLASRPILSRVDTPPEADSASPESVDNGEHAEKSTSAARRQAHPRRARHHQTRPPRPLPRASDRPIRDLDARGADLVVLDQGVDTSTPASRMFFQILGAIAEFEHALMSGRTRDGLAATRGRTGGQKPKHTPRQAKIAQTMYDELDDAARRVHTVQQIADEFGVTRPTLSCPLQRAAA